ncbi:hypothetical protein EJV47_13305 [Hymenobacter gummosus]|uniref:DUF4149 domain-containing protein n=1 Tax=Hymenobacter gummosus TaxID=1776032 RepID=A0A3S0JGF4_9BACT|nr:hypothetical protein [Hymenobacter gummosus]RTQ49123.1 hypothetical protein EJV47_13305 [Hymenobacter gummosus]
MRPSFPTFSLLLVLSLFLWAGLVLGISFLEAPLKFTAPHITTALGVGIGRVVFHALNKVELLLGLVALLAASRLCVPGRIWASLLPAAAVLLAQTVWLLPALDVRAEALLAGRPQPESWLHWAYIGLEAAKVLALLISGSLAFRWALRSAQPAAARPVAA